MKFKSEQKIKNGDFRKGYTSEEAKRDFAIFIVKNLPLDALERLLGMKEIQASKEEFNKAFSENDQLMIDLLKELRLKDKTLYISEVDC